ncbi:chemotaxis protein CheD [Paenisporosarcina quisquiliarum]|jgi:chemotaxis protein CheD|uniref:chemotaxis protein CheD n=1 Tax=Psychrobacillus TaxID=1221880 RepID=UPI0008B7DD65|nr:chemotaxis protein CheD [Psychrobacillus psychrodurans]MCK1996140.1 chemotaxis protein CheD [Psychrobacillus psychrodurans]MCZ8539559.1 chemotaxis protein CheD [Psychrobacillus psychrodurans]SEM21155.1 chemotaxis protein CheD [Paenisporosarcina quisquiliarum]SFM41660.1 chemotaxis protein CheD [Psychrobacillus psychrodurans]
MNAQGQIVKVGIADMNIAKAPDKIRTSGLGSCVGVVLYDERSTTVGMIHVMLPDSSLGRAEAINIAKFADTGIPAMVEQLKIEGIQPYKLKAKIAGGAQMFQFSTTSETMRIGPRNVEAVKEYLKKFSIPIIAEDTGGNSGRTIEFDPTTKLLNIRTVNQGVRDI